MAKIDSSFELLIFKLLGGEKVASEMIYLEPNIQRMLKSKEGGLLVDLRKRAAVECFGTE